MTESARVYRIGCVPYLNGKPLIAWFHSGECSLRVRLVYDTPARLANMLHDGELDVAMVSTFELIRNRSMEMVSGISIAADGPVKSVRLFCGAPIAAVRSVALDTSSLTSTALTRILLAELYGLHPVYLPHAPALDAMLNSCDAALIIGDLKLFQHPTIEVLDIGELWKRLTGLPFIYAGWLGPRDGLTDELISALGTACDWGCARLDELARHWAWNLGLPLARVEDYYKNVMIYRSTADCEKGLAAFEQKCIQHGLLSRLNEMPTYKRNLETGTA